MYAYVYICMFICMHAFTYVCINVYVCMYASKHAGMCELLTIV